MSETGDWDEIQKLYYGENSDVIKIRMRNGVRAGQFLALKYISLLGQSDDPLMAEKLKRLYETCCELKGLRHENLLEIIEVRQFQVEMKVALIMELVENGKSLENLVKEKRGPIEEGQLRSYSTQICSALNYLHSKNRVYRNISSSAVILSADLTRVKLLDFGVSVKLINASCHQTGCTRGRTNYLPPELCTLQGFEGRPQMADSELPTVSTASAPGDSLFEYRKSVDIWSFGCLVYEMATGCVPYAECRRESAVRDKIAKDGAPDLPENVSINLKEFYRSCVSTEPRARLSAFVLLNHTFITGR